MLETPDWMREKIGDYRALSAIVADYETKLKNDQEIKNLKTERALLDIKINKLAKDRLLTIEEAKQEQQMIKMELLDHWDIEGKSFKCDMGSATLRTKKTLEINDQNALLAWLFKLERLESAIRTLDTAYLKRLKDADMIPDALAFYESSTNVAIAGAKK